MPHTDTCPLSTPDAIDLYFMEHRAKLIDIAAFLDRLDRTQGGDEAAGDDVRIRAFYQAIELLSDGKPERVRRIMELLSDHTVEPIERAPGKGAIGVYPQGSYQGLKAAGSKGVK